MSNDSDAKTSPASVTAKPRRKHRFLKFVGVVFLLLVIIVALLPYIVPATWLAGAIEQAAKAHIRGSFKLGAVSWGWLGGVQIDGISIGETSESGSGTFLKVSRVNVHVSFLDLLRKKITVKSVTVKAPEINLTRSTEGAWNYQGIFAREMPERRLAVASIAPAPEGKFDVAVESVRIEDGVLRLDDRKANMKITADNISAAVDADFSGQTIKGEAKVSFDLIQADGKGRFELAAADLSIPKQQTADAMQMMAGRGTVTVTGIDIAEAIAQTMPQSGKDLAGGKLSVSIDYELAGGSVKAVAKAGTVKGLVLGKSAGFAAPVAVGDVSFAFDVAAKHSETADSATLNSLTLSTAFADLNSSGKADVTQTTKNISAKASGSVDPAALPKGLVELPPDFKTTGRAKFEASFDGSPDAGKFSAVLDAGGMKVAFGDTLRKESGVPAGVNVSGEMLKGMIAADKLAVNLSGGTIEGKGTFDRDNKIATWDIAADLKGLNVADYYPGSKSLVVAGGFTHSGKFMLTTPKRASSFSIDTKFNDLSVDVTDKPGKELQISGGTAFNSERADMSGLVVTVGGMPITIEGSILTPLAHPNGTIKVRGKEISADSLMAVADALKSAVPAAQAPAAEKPAEQPAPSPAPAPGEEKPVAEKAKTAGREYVNTANINLDLAVDRFTYKDFTGDNLKVDAGINSGKAVVRKATVDIWGGSVDVTYQANLLAEGMPFDLTVAAARVSATDASRPFMGKWLGGVPISNLVDVKLQAAGKLAGAVKEILSSINGNGEVDVSDGRLSLGSMPGQAGMLLAGLDLANISVPKMNIPVTISNGTMAYSYGVPTGDYKVFIDVTAVLAGGMTQKVSVTLPGSDQKIHLFSLVDNKRVDVDAGELAADLAKAQLKGAIQKEITKSTGTGEKVTKEKAAEEIGGAILNILTKDKKK